MGIGFIYQVGIILVNIAAGSVLLQWLDRSETDRIARCLRVLQGPLFLSVGGVVITLLIFAVPYGFGFEFNDYGFYTGLIIYGAWWVVFANPKLKSLRERVLRHKMSELGEPGARMADLAVRKLRSYISRRLLAVPYLMLLAISLPVALWMDQPSRTTLLLVLLLGAGLTLLVTTRMYALVREPVDLRSSAPKDFRSKLDSYLKKRVRHLYFFQLTNAVLLLVAVTVGFYTPLVSPLWVFAGLAPFMVFGMWESHAKATGVAKLDSQRWTAGKQEPRI